MKILCLHHDIETDFLAQDPIDALAEHTVTSVHTYEAAKALLTRSSSDPFDVMLTDIIVPFSATSLSPFPSMLLLPYVDGMELRVWEFLSLLTLRPRGRFKGQTTYLR